MREKLGRTRNAIAAGLRDKVQVAAVVIFGRAEEPSIEPVGCPRCPSVAIFVDDGFRTERCDWIAVPIVRALEDFVC